MPFQHKNLSSEDREAYKAWMRRICLIYGVAVALGLALVAFQATSPTDNTARSLTSETLAAD